jgi:hypothetical protein
VAINYNAMADFDPMGAMAEYKFKADKAARERADWELAHKAKQQAWSDNQNLRALAEQLQKGKEVPTEVQTGEMANMGPVEPPQSLRDMAPTMQVENTAKDFGGGSPLKFAQTVANPQYAEAMKAYGDQVKSAPQTIPLMETQMKNVPYTTGEKSQKFAEQLLKQGDIAGALKATESVLKLDEAMPKHMTDMHKLVNQEAMSELSAGTSPDQVGKNIAAKYRMAGNEAAASLAENSKVLPNGVMVTPAPGGTVMTKYTADGGYSIDYHVAKAPTAEKVYGNPRTVKFGDELVKEHPIFEGANAERNKAAWEKAGGNFDKLGDFNGYSKKDNENSQKISVSVGTGKEKLLSSNDIEKLEERRNSKDLLGTLKTSYKPEYRPAAGKYTTSNTIGELELKIEKSLGNNTEAINWWNQYFEWANKELKKQSGAAVTPPEYKRFLQEAISTSTDPALVTKFLERREKRAGENYNQMADGLGVGRERAVSTYRESGNKPESKLPAGAVTGTYKGQKAYHVGPNVFDMSGKRLN